MRFLYYFRKDGQINDYAVRHYNGVVGEYYLKRWNYFFNYSKTNGCSDHLGFFRKKQWPKNGPYFISHEKFYPHHILRSHLKNMFGKMKFYITLSKNILTLRLHQQFSPTISGENYRRFSLIINLSSIKK